MRVLIDRWGVVFILLCAFFMRILFLEVPDLFTDEAQFILGRSAAQPPLGMWLFRLMQSLFGYHIGVARFTSVVVGMTGLFVLYEIARRCLSKRGVLYCMIFASFFPTHILFSRLAYLSIFLQLGWLLVLLCFLRASEERSWSLFALYASVVIATFMKTQGLLFPVLLLLGLVAQYRLEVWKQKRFWIIALGLVPFAVYLLTHPGILATVMLYAGNRFAIGNVWDRALELVQTWFSVMHLTVFYVLAALPFLRRFPWPVVVLICLGSLLGLYFDPLSAYYSTHLLLFALPLAALCLRLPSYLSIGTVSSFVVIAFLLYGPVLNPWTYSLYRQEGYWNQHATAINAVIEDEKVYSIGSVGHHVRWYIDATVRAPTMNYRGSGTYLMLDETSLPGKELYDDGVVRVIQR